MGASFTISSFAMTNLVILRRDMIERKRKQKEEKEKGIAKKKGNFTCGINFEVMRQKYNLCVNADQHISLISLFLVSEKSS